GSVRNMNVMVESVPSNFIAGPFGFKTAQYFELENEADRAAPVVKFN
ncbi:MAG: LemA family protein, partial [Devosia sp.]|nr:LemA family protein [Devosia sp.]